MRDDEREMEPEKEQDNAVRKRDRVRFVNARPTSSERERLKAQRLVRAHVGRWISDQTKDRSNRGRSGNRTLRDSISPLSGSSSDHAGPSSYALTMNGSMKEAYVDELVHELLKAVSRFRIDSSSRRRVANAMPDCLKAFSLRLGSAELSQKTHQNVTAFVHKHRQ